MTEHEEPIAVDDGEIIKQMDDLDCAVVFTEPDNAEDKYKAFGFKILTPATLEEDEDADLPMNAIVATAVAVFLADESNLDIIMRNFYDKADEVESAEGASDG